MKHKENHFSEMQNDYKNNNGTQFRETLNIFFQGWIFRMWSGVLFFFIGVIFVLLWCETNINNEGYSQRFVFAVPVDVDVYGDTTIYSKKGFEIRLEYIGENYKGSKGYLIPNPGIDKSDGIRVSNEKEKEVDILVQNIIKLEYKHPVSDTSDMWTVQHLDDSVLKPISLPYIIGKTQFDLCKSWDDTTTKKDLTKTQNKGILVDPTEDYLDIGHDIYLYTISLNGLEITKYDRSLYAWLLDYDGTLFRYKFEKPLKMGGKKSASTSQIPLTKIDRDSASSERFGFITTGWQSLDLVDSVRNESITFLAANGKNYKFAFFRIVNPYDNTPKIYLDSTIHISSKEFITFSILNPFDEKNSKSPGPKRWDEGAALHIDKQNLYLLTTDAHKGSVYIWDYTNPNSPQNKAVWRAEKEGLPAYLEGVDVNRNNDVFTFDRSGILRYVQDVDFANLDSVRWLEKSLDYVTHGQDVAIDPITGDIWIATEFFLQRLSIRLFSSWYRALESIKTNESFILIIWVALFIVTIVVRSSQILLNKEREHKERLKAYTTRLENISIKKFAGIVGDSKEMQKVFNEIEKIAETDFTVLITGERGTGKELVAKAIQSKSKRHAAPFISINCSRLKDLDSDLFGYAPGTFTGGLKEGKIGFIEAANSGTVFLDEIGTMPLNTQAELLRVLQEREIRRLGENFTRSVNVRFIVATNENLENVMKEKRFREDLFDRLNQFNIHLPPLRERKSDIPKLAQYFINELIKELGEKDIRIDMKELTEADKEHLQSKNWEGNVRELQNYIRKALLKSPSGNRIYWEDHQIEYQIERIPVSLNFEVFWEEKRKLPTWDEFIYEYLKRIYHKEKNWERIAKILNVNRKTLDDRRKNLERKFGKI